MAYKDEFEVARLMTGDAFSTELAEQFEGDFKVKYHMAPPVLNWRTDARGRPAKRAFGPWLRPVLGHLVRFKSLRGSALNPFGHHGEARMHRDTLAWYEALLDRAQRDFTADNQEAWQEALSAADEIRGYGPVREEAVKRARVVVEQTLS